MGTCCSCLPLGRVTKQDVGREGTEIELETIREEEDEATSMEERCNLRPLMMGAYDQTLVSLLNLGMRPLFCSTHPIEAHKGDGEGADSLTLADWGRLSSG
ncbi:hypothetical protein DPX16_17975 [Anabarilius grahami]|uniref:Uncharacterized protein n=1 Tax=Anabarilius grahami TaxID=495550 RepID=A0A3N0XTE0_ANAGA|nr:hypothetical protein DPX16_17975 [Anabarilius grahami]